MLLAHGIADIAVIDTVSNAGTHHDAALIALDTGIVATLLALRHPALLLLLLAALLLALGALPALLLAPLLELGHLPGISGSDCRPGQP